MIVLITGGAKNGKSSYAQELAVRLSPDGRRYYIATMIPVDEEDRERIRRHIADRDGLGFETVECGRNIASVLDMADPEGTFLLDSTTALLMNEFFVPPDYHVDEAAPRRCAEQLMLLADRVRDLILVSDYIYSDAERYDAVTESYRKGLAAMDRALARRADAVLEFSAGNSIFLKGEGLL